MNVNDVSLMEFLNLLLWRLSDSKIPLPGDQEIWHWTFLVLKRMDPPFPVGSVSTLRFDWGERVLRAPDLADTFQGLLLSGCAELSASAGISRLHLDPDVADRWKATLIRNAKPELMAAVDVAKDVLVAKLDAHCRKP